MSHRFHQRIYRLYSTGSRSSYGLRNRISSLGWIVICALPVSGFMAAFYPRGTFFQLFGVIVAVLVGASVSAIFRVGQVQVRRSLPRHATVGVPLEYTVNYTNVGRRSLSNFYLVDLAPDPTPTRDVFLHATEPGEEKRNVFDRLFLAYRWSWLRSRFLLMRSQPSLGKPVNRSDEKSVRLELMPLRRGVIHLNRMQIILPDILGIFQRMHRVEQDEDVLIILPKRYQIDNFDFAGQARSQVGGESSTSVQGQSGEFVSLREYRPGDPPKHIHWPSWGRTGKPILKEYEEVFFPRYGLVLDTAVRAEYESVFEEVVSVAATLASEVDTEQSLIDVMFIQQGAKVQTVGKNVERMDVMLELLASVEIDPVPDWDALRKAVLKHGDDMATCFLVLGDWDEGRASFVEQLCSQGISVHIFVIQESNTPVNVISEHAPVTVLTVGKVEQELGNLVL